MQQQINDVVIIIVLIFLGMSGNIFYRINYSLKVHPLHVRFFMGVMTAVIYTLFYTFILKEIPHLEPFKMISAFGVGYCAELILKHVPDVINTYLGRFGAGGNKDDKK